MGLVSLRLAAKRRPHRSCCERARRLFDQTIKLLRRLGDPTPTVSADHWNRRGHEFGYPGCAVRHTRHFRNGST